MTDDGQNGVVGSARSGPTGAKLPAIRRETAIAIGATAVGALALGALALGALAIGKMALGGSKRAGAVWTIW
jgi:hypothetical protein